ncbi:unnamed protein product [Effrenium voratum]|uniref:Mitochondrial splicing suppressor 51-like C-terminal domain-containing protein n=1 Tax=Effrenium voratum TaxID=2562239 RepID=A0AA36IAK2_9DINO|nr:unnamed protein product [Effrenium voratum]
MREGDLTRSPEVEVQGLRLQGHEFTQQSPDRPDLAVCFNSGVGTLALTIASPWLPTLAALLKLDVPLLFTSFGPQERKGEDFILKQLFQAQVLVDVLENPFRQMPEDRPGCYSTLEEDLSGDGEHLCNAQIWWARGSQLPAKELDQVAARAVRVLEELTQSFAMKGAHKSWLLALTKGSRRVGEAALENFQAAFKSPEVLRVLGKLGRRIAEAIACFVGRHGPHPLARPLVEEVLLAKVKLTLGGEESVLREARPQLKAICACA